MTAEATLNTHAQTIATRTNIGDSTANCRPTLTKFLNRLLTIAASHDAQVRSEIANLVTRFLPRHGRAPGPRGSAARSRSPPPDRSHRSLPQSCPGQGPFRAVARLLGALLTGT